MPGSPFSSLTPDPENRYTTLVWRFLPVAVDRSFALNPGLERTQPIDQKFPPEQFDSEAHPPRRSRALEGLCTRLFALAVSNTGSLPAM
jgi:hypothetical protein